MRALPILVVTLVVLRASPAAAQVAAPPEAPPPVEMGPTPPATVAPAETGAQAEQRLESSRSAAAEQLRVFWRESKSLAGRASAAPAAPPPAAVGDGDRDLDGIPDSRDLCPDLPEDKDGFEDEDGCPDPDNDKDGIPDAQDKCPNEPETFNGFEDEDGCPDVAPLGSHQAAKTPPPVAVAQPPPTFAPSAVEPSPVAPHRAAEPQPQSAGAGVEAIDQAPVTRMRQDNAFAIVIGIERYRGTLPLADHADNDARTMARYLERTLGLQRQNIRLLLGERASKSDIEAALDEWLPAHARPGVPIYFYYSGHGAPDPSTGDTYLVPWDGEPEYLKTKGLRLSRIYQGLEKTRGKVLAMVDACFSGAGGHSVLPAGTRPLVAVKETAPTGANLAVLAAAQATQITGAARSGGHGLFTYHLLRGLAGAADRDGDHTVTLHELDVFIRRNVESDAREQNREQSPRLSLGGGKPGDWVVVEGLVE